MSKKILTFLLFNKYISKLCLPKCILYYIFTYVNIPEFLCFMIGIPLTYNRRRIYKEARKKKNPYYKLIKPFFLRKKTIMAAIKKNKYDKVKNYFNSITSEEIKDIVNMHRFSDKTDERILELFKPYGIRLDDNSTDIRVIRNILIEDNYRKNRDLIFKFRLDGYYGYLYFEINNIIQTNNTELFIEIFNQDMHIEYSSINSIILNKNYVMLEAIAEKNIDGIVSLAILNNNKDILDKYFDKCNYKAVFKYISKCSDVIDITICDKLLELTGKIDYYILCNIKLDNVEYIKNCKINFKIIPNICFSNDSVKVFKYLYSIGLRNDEYYIEDYNEFIIKNNLIEYEIHIDYSTINEILIHNRLNFFKKYITEIKNHIELDIYGMEHLNHIKNKGMYEFLDILI